MDARDWYTGTHENQFGTIIHLTSLLSYPHFQHRSVIKVNVFWRTIS
jgi:hypothetical protein